ncbi:MAG TPA: stage II sporulation protein M [Candidatus Acidoferrales bacterium]|nr:stage II sporulation protein M [Candidatus Acidoferrales bacterium]
MREAGFISRRQAGWEELEALLREADRHGLTHLGGERLWRLATLYRGATSDLAAARTREYDREIQLYLNRLTARAHAYVYAGTVRGGWSRLAAFFTQTFPAEVRASGRPILACAALFVVATIVAYALVSAHWQDAYALVPADEIPLVTKSLHDSNFGFDHRLAPAMSALIITNNIQVTAIAFAGGMTLGVVTLWAILNNGLMLGATGALFAAKGFGLDFWATIAPHGVIELSAIQIAGGAGLLIASGIIAPGRLRRVDALRLRARRAGILILGVAAMLVVAGTIEGFVSPQKTPETFRISVGAVTALALVLYFGFAGRTHVSSSAL